MADLAQAAIPASRATDGATPTGSYQTYFVFFEAGKASLTPEARLILHSAARQVHAMHQAKVRVMLPTGVNGATALLQNRAIAVKAELMRDGVKPRSIANAEQPRNAYANVDPGTQDWLDRSAIVEILPVPNAGNDGQVG
jgi:hypothetical protein